MKPGPPCSLRDLEMQAIAEALDRHAGNKPKAAEELGISLKTLYNKLNQASGAGEVGVAAGGSRFTTRTWPGSQPS